MCASHTVSYKTERCACALDHEFQAHGAAWLQQSVQTVLSPAVSSWFVHLHGRYLGTLKFLFFPLYS